MQPYHVTWEIDVEADTPMDAAGKALKIQRDPDSIATVFMVEHAGHAETVTWVDLAP